jgi:hypothetical protein
MINTLNCSSEQMRTLCEVIAVDEICSEFVVTGSVEMFEVEDVDSIVGILEPCPTD